MAAKKKRRSSQHDLVLQPINPMSQRRIRIYLSLFIVLALIGAWVGGEYTGRYLQKEYADELADLRQEYMLQGLELQAARDELALHRTGAEVAEEAQGQVRSEIKELRNQLAELEEAVAFYKSVMSPNSAEQGLRIEKFTITPASDPGTYSYRLVLTQVGDNRRRISGNVMLSLQGGAEGSLVDLPLKEQLKPQSETTYRFRYYQELEGGFMLPDNLAPKTIKVEVNVAGSRQDKQEQILVWPLEK